MKIQYYKKEINGKVFSLPKSGLLCPKCKSDENTFTYGTGDQFHMKKWFSCDKCGLEFWKVFLNEFELHEV